MRLLISLWIWRGNPWNKPFPSSIGGNSMIVSKGHWLPRRQGSQATQQFPSKMQPSSCFSDSFRRYTYLYSTFTRRCPLGPDDIAYIFEDLNLGRSSLPPHHVQTKPALVRWYKDQPLTCWNCVVLSHEEADRHMEQVLLGSKTGEQLWGVEAEHAVRKRAREARRIFEWRLS